MLEATVSGRPAAAHLRENRFVAILFAAIALSACSPQQPSASPSPPPRPTSGGDTAGTRAIEVIGVVDDPTALDTFLRAKADKAHPAPPRSVVARTVDGGPVHRRMTLVYLADPHWCGSGGCPLLIIVPGDSGLSELARVTLVHPPVLVLDTRSNGMPDISVRVRGDYYPGQGPKFVRLAFDGQTYASNPTMPAAQLLSGPADGQIAISEAETDLAFGH